MTTTMLYRASDTANPELWNLPLQHTIVADEDVEAALAEGWVRHPSDLQAADTAEDKKPRVPRQPKTADTAEG